jgi:hypothetical protein
MRPLLVPVPYPHIRPRPEFRSYDPRDVVVTVRLPDGRVVELRHGDGLTWSDPP